MLKYTYTPLGRVPKPDFWRTLRDFFSFRNDYSPGRRRIDPADGYGQWANGWASIIYPKGWKGGRMN